MPIDLTDRAADKIKDILGKKGLPTTAGLRFGVRGGGCSGFEYVVDVEPNPRKFDMPAKTDTVFVSKGARIIVDKKSYLFLNGMEIDWEEKPFGHSFVYKNPNAKGVCGCGTSFSV